jgi:putative membrane protein
MLSVSEGREIQMTQMSSTTKLALDRTRLAYERTMMAWIRTATSLITFGFSIYRFFQIETAKSAPGNEGVFGSANFAMLMIVTGLTALLIATLENRRDLHALRTEYPDISIPRSWARLLAALVSTLGILALVAVILRK